MWYMFTCGILIWSPTHLAYDCTLLTDIGVEMNGVGLPTEEKGLIGVRVLEQHERRDSIITDVVYM